MVRSNVVQPPSMPAMPPGMPEIPVIPENVNRFQYLMNTNPVLLWSMIVAMISSSIGLGVAFGLDVSEEKQQAIYVFAVAIWPILGVAGVMGRSQAWSPASVANVTGYLLEEEESALPGEPEDWVKMEKPGEPSGYAPMSGVSALETDGWKVVPE